MAIEIKITPELEHQLQQVADEAGIAPDVYVIRLLQQNLQQARSNRNTGRQLPPDEAELLQRINRSLPQIEWQRYHQLLQKRHAETLTPNEHTELITISDQIEEINAHRIQDLAELAQLRHITIHDLIVELGLKPTSHA